VKTWFAYAVRARFLKVCAFSFCLYRYEQATLQRLQAQAKAAREGRSIADVSEEAGTRLLTAAEEAEEEEKEYKRDLDREMKGIPYSRWGRTSGIQLESQSLLESAWSPPGLNPCT
jgi:hypothetical protein